MTNIIHLGMRQDQIKKATDASKNLHIKEAQQYSLEEAAIGIEIAIVLFNDQDAAQFLINKMQQSINKKSIEISLNLFETRKYLDYLDIINSNVNQELRLQLAKHKYS